MTFKEAMINELTSRGMFQNQAEEVIEKCITETDDAYMQKVWGENLSAYPTSLKTIVWLSVKHTAYEWIQANAPEAWFRPMFQFSDAELTQMMQSKN